MSCKAPTWRTVGCLSGVSTRPWQFAYDTGCSMTRRFNFWFASRGSRDGRDGTPRACGLFRSRVTTRSSFRSRLADAFNDEVRSAIASGLRTTLHLDVELRMVVPGWVGSDRCVSGREHERISATT